MSLSFILRGYVRAARLVAVYIVPDLSMRPCLYPLVIEGGGVYGFFQCFLTVLCLEATLTTHYDSAAHVREVHLATSRAPPQGQATLPSPP